MMEQQARKTKPSKEVHPAMERIYTALLSRGLIDQDHRASSLARLINAKAQSIENWENRGPSRNALLMCMSMFGINGVWVATGEGNMFMSKPDFSGAIRSLRESTRHGQTQAADIVPIVEDAATLTSLRMRVAALERIATGQVKHLFQGSCPDVVSGHQARDPQCPACQLLGAPGPGDAPA